MDDCNIKDDARVNNVDLVQIPLWTIVTSRRVTARKPGFPVQIPLWTIVTCRLAESRPTWQVQIPLWTIVT